MCQGQRKRERDVWSKDAKHPMIRDEYVLEIQHDVTMPSKWLITPEDAPWPIRKLTRPWPTTEGRSLSSNLHLLSLDSSF